MAKQAEASDHEAAVRKMMQPYFLGKPNWEKMASFIAEYGKRLEDIFLDVQNNTTLQKAPGLVLDQLWGKLLNEPRRGRDDERYRLALMGKLQARHSHGTASQLIALFKALTQSGRVALEEVSKTILLAADHATVEETHHHDIRQAMKKAKAAGVELILMSCPEDSLDFYDEDGDFPSFGEGFADEDTPDSGGHLMDEF